MSTTDPTGDRGGGGGGGGLASITPTDDNVTPVTSSTGVAVSPASHHQQHPPPSPLSGCYLLVVLPEPHTAQHKDLILNRLAKGFLSWDKDSCHVDLEKELQALVAQAPEGEEARNGERLIQYATENLVTEVLIHPQTNTLLQCMRNLLASFTKHRHIIHAGYTFSGNGSWILQDGTFSLADFLDAFSEHEVQRVLRAYENSVTVDINCAGVGEWSTSRLSKEACTRSCRVRLNPDDVLTAGVPAITSFTSYVGQYLVSQTLDQLMEPSDVVGNIRFSHPTLYVFPGGQGDAALFGINGFNMLVDGGFARKACFWDFARHLDRLDAVLMTRINNSNVGGMSSVLRKKREMHVYPQIGHFFCNLIERKSLNSPDGDKDLDPLILNLTDIGHEMMVDLRHINLRAHPCYRDPNPINLYHKVGHGTLDMYVLSPSKDSREVREFLSKWHASDSKLFSGSYRKDSNNLTFPIQNLASICALLVWQPANPEDTITRILFPGSTPQHKIFEGIERLKHLEFLKHPVCTAKSISPSTSLLTLKDKPTTKQKLGLIEESRKASDAKKERRELLDSKLSKASDDSVGKATPQGTPVNQPPKVQPPKIDVKTKKVIENKKIETESKKIEKDLKEHKKEPVKKPDAAKTEKDSEVKKVEGYKIKVDNERAALSKEPKAKPEPKKKETKESKPAKTSRAEPVTKAAMRIGDKKQKSPADKRDSMKASPTTPKKSMNGAATKVELSRATSRPITKPSAKTLTSTMPAKSAKDANNRKVVEQKNIEIASAESAAAPASAKAPPKQKAAERKPIGRRPKPISPIKARLPISPTKSTRSTPTTSVKSDKDGIIRKIKGDRGTADSSTVSTPSGIEIDSMTKLADKCLTEKSEDMSLDSIESKVLADLKEEREVVEEIEAVLQKAERIEGARRDDHLEGDDDITAEATDKKEDDMTEDDVTAEIEEIPKKESSRKTSHELTEEDEYLIIEKEEIYIEDSVQSGEVEEKHAPGAAVDDEEAKTRLDAVPTKEEEEEEEEDDEGGEQEEAEVSEEKEKADIPEKQLGLVEGKLKEAEEPEKPASSDQVLEEQMKNIIASTAEMLQKTEDKDDSGKKDSEDITKEPSSLSPDKFDSSEKKTTDTDVKPETDQKDRQVPEKLEESHERMSTLESGATTTAPTLPEDERIPLDEIKEVVDEKCLADQETKPDGEIKAPEPLAAQIQPEAKPDAKAFEVHPPLHGIQREIVKTPDEVADLPVHEEVDPTLYRMEHFEKGKEEKPVQQPPAPQKELKEPEIPAAKEPKGVFSFFGKVADKFEKGIDKLTGKSRRDSEKDIDEKSSSKSGSPKEVKAQSIAFPGSATAEEITAGLTKVAEASELPETFEEGIPDLTQVKVAAIKDTATFLADEIADLKKTSPPHKEPSDSKGETAMAELVSEAPQASEPVFETCHVKEKIDKITADELEGEDDVEEVEALLAEASKKFKDVKDSLHDSLESLEERLAEQELARAELHAISKDFVKDTLSEVVEKLEDMKPKDLDELVEKKEHDEAEEAPGEEEEEEEEDLDEAVVTKDLKGAVRDVGEVLAGSAGILIDDKPKDVIEIVKKVAEVLKKDDFLSHDVLFDPDAPEAKEDEKSSPKVSTEAAIIPKKVEATEELPSQEEIAESRGSRRESIVSAQKPTAAGESPKDSASKAPTPTPSPTKDAVQEKMEAMKICAEFLDEEPILPRQKRSADEDPAKKDVVEAGIEAVCVKQKVDKPTRVESEADDESKEQSIVFDRKVSPVTAEVVIVTPDLSPTSPALPSDKIHTEGAQAQPEVSDVSQLLPHDILNALKSNEPLEQLIEQLVYTKKVKITREIVEFIIIVRKISRYDVIRIIERIILKKGSPPDSVVTDLRVLTDDVIPTEKREDVENHIIKEYVTNNKKITMKVIDEISNQKGITRRILVTIIIEIIIKKNIQREGLLDLSEKELSELDLDEPEAEEQDKLSEASEISGIEDEAQDIASSDKYSAVRTFIENEVIAKGKKITPQLIDDVCVAKLVPRRVFIEIIEKIMVERKIPRSSMVDISEKEMSELLASEKEHAKLEEDEDGDADQSGSSTPDRGQEIAAYISDEFIAKKKKITLQNFKDICSRNDVSVQMLWNLIDNVIEKQKLDRAVVMDISENELSDLLTVEEEEMTREDAAEVSAPASNRAEIESSIVEEFVSKNRRITPYIFEDICLRYKVPRRIIIEIIETIIVKRNLQRNSILDITDTELTELLDVVEAQDEEEAEGLAKSPAKGQEPQDDADEDKLVDGFVSISSKDDVKVEDVLRKKSVTPVVGKESEKDVDDFEAVEQEYKIHGLSLTPDKELPLTSQMISDEKMLDEVEDVVQDHSSDVVEAKEKIVGTALKPASPTKAEEKPLDVSEHSEALDTTEKYLVEAKEKTESAEVSKSKPVSPSSDTKSSESPIEKDALGASDEISVQESAVTSSAPGGLEGEAKPVQSDVTSPKPSEVATSPELPDNDAKIGTAAVRKPSTAGHQEEQEETRRSEEESTKATSRAGSLSPKDEKSSKDDSLNEETPLSSSTVHRMVVTASSEDGGHEMEVCPSGSITFTPEDSLKSSPIKTTPDQDSLRLDKESVHSGISTPERDSISDKSATVTKDGEKITPEDSLDKSPSVTRGSQDLEDSLDKSDLTKLKETKGAERPSEEREDAAVRHVSETIDEKLEGDADTKVTNLVESTDVSEPDSEKVTSEKPDEVKKDSGSPVSEKSVKSHEGSPTIEAVGATETGASQLEPSKLREEEPVEKTDVTEKPRSLASEIQSAIEQKTGTDVSGVTVEPIVQTKSPSPSKESESDEIHDRVKRSSVFDSEPTELKLDTKHVDEPESKLPSKGSTPPTGDQHKDGEVLRKLSSHDISPSDIDKSRSPSVSSDVKHAVDDHEEDTIPELPEVSKSLESAKSEDKLVTPVEGLHDKKPEDAVHSTASNGKSEPGTESLESAISPSVESRKASMVDSKVLTDKQDEIVSKDLLAESEVSRKDSIAEKHEDSMTASRSPSITTEAHDEREKISRSRSPSIVGSEHDQSEKVDSVSSIVSAEKQSGIEDTETSKLSTVVSEKLDGKSPISPTIAHEKEDEKESLAGSKSPSIAGEKDLTDRSRSPSVVAEKQDEKAAIDGSKSPSVPSEKEDERESIERSRSPSVTTGKQDEKETIDRSKSPSIAGDKKDEKESVDRSKSPSIASEKGDEKESIERSRSASLVPEKQDVKDSGDRSKSPSVVSEKDEKESIERSRSPSVATEKPDEKGSIDRSRSPSIAGERLDEKVPIDGSKSPSVASEKGEEKEFTDRSRSPSVAVEKQGEKETIDRSKSPSVTSEKEEAKESMERSRSTSLASERHDEKEPEDRSRSPSMAAEKADAKEAIDRSKSPSVASEKDEKEPVDHSRTASVATEKHDEKERPDGSKSPSIASETGETKESVDRSRSPSVAPEKQDEKETIDRSKSPSLASEKEDEKAPIDRSRSPSVTTEKQEEKETIDRSKSPSVASEKAELEQPIDHSKSPSVASEKAETEQTIDRSKSPSVASEKAETEQTIDRSKSPSIASEKAELEQTIERSKSPSVASEKAETEQTIDRSKSPSVASEKAELEQTIERSKSPSVASEKAELEQTIERSKSPSVASEKAETEQTIDRSKSPSVASEKAELEQTIERSKSPSLASEKAETEQTIDRSKSPSVASEKGEIEQTIDRSRSSSVATEKQVLKDAVDQPKSPSAASEKDEKEMMERSRSTSLVPEKQDEKEPIDRSKSPSVAGDKDYEKESIDRSRSPSVITETPHVKEATDGSKSPSVASEKDEKEMMDRSRSATLAPEKQDDKKSVDGSKSPSVASEKDEKETTVRSRSASLAPEKQDDKKSVDGSRSPSVASEKDEKDLMERSRSASLVPEKPDLKESADGSKSPSVAGDKEDEKESIDRSRSPSVITEKQHETKTSDHSKSPSVAGDKEDEKESIDRSRSPSVATEKEHEKDKMDRSKSPSVASEKDEKESMERSRSASLVPERKDEKESTDRSRSPSVVGEKQDEKAETDRSKSPSVASEKEDERVSIDRSRSPSVATEKPDEKEAIERSKSPSVTSEKKDEKESIDRSKSPSIASEKADEKEPTERSRSASLVPEKQDEKDSIDRSKSPSVAGEKDDEKASLDRSKSPSAAIEKQDEKDSIDRSRTASLVPEKQEEILSIDRSKSPSVASEKDDEKPSLDRSRSPSAAIEKQDGKEAVDRSKSPSVASDKDEKESVQRSRSASLAPEKPDEKESTDRSRSPSVQGEKQDEKASIERSKSPSVASEKDEGEAIDRSRSSSVTTGKQDEKETIDRSKSPSIAGDKKDEKESVDRSKSPSIASEKGDEKESIERSRSASLVPEKQDVKDSGDRSKSPSVVSEKDEKESIERSRSPSVATEKPDEKGSIDRSRSPSIAGERLDEKAPIDGSKSPSVASEKGEEKESTDRSRSPSVAVEKQGEKETIDRSKSPSVTSEKEEAKESMERSRSTSLASERHDEKEPEDRSRSPSMTAEKADAKEAIDRSKSPSVASEKDEKEPVDRSRSASVATEKHDEKERPDGSKSPSIASEKGEEKEPIDRSRSPSVAVEKQGEKEPIDRSKSPSVTSEKGDEKETVDRSRSASIATEKQDTKESIDRSKSPSIASEKDEKEPIDRSRSPSVAADKKDEKEPADRSGSVSPALEKQVEIEPIDQSRSPSIAPEKQDEKGSSDRSKSPSVASEKGEEKEIIDRSRSASLALEKPDELQPIASSKSPSLASEKGEEKEIIDRSRSASLAPEKPGELQPAIDTSKSPSVAGDVADEKESVGRSRSPSIVVDKPDGKEERPAGSKSPSTSPAKEDTKEPLGRSRSSSIADDKPSEKASVDHSRSPSIAAEKPEEKPFDVSTSPSTGVEKPAEKETIDGSKSPSPASDKQEKTEVTDRSRSPSIAGEKQDEKESSERSRTASIVPEQPESIDRSKSPSIAGEKPDELELSDRLRSPSITGSKQEIAESADRSKSPSIAGDKREGDEIPRSRSSSVASGKPDAKDSIDGSKSPSIAGEKHDEKESFERSRSTSVVSARLEEKESIDHSRSASIAGEKQEEIESIGRSRSASVAVGKPDDKEAIARSRSASIAFGHEEQELTDRSRSGSIAGEKKILDRSRSSSVVVEKQEEEELLDRSRSGSVAVETKDEKESEAKESITEGSITGEKTSEKTSADASRSASLSPQEQIGTEPADRSRSSSTVGVAPKETESTVHSRSPSIADGKKDAEQLIEHSRSPSLVSTILDKVDSILRPESLAAVDGKQGEKDSPASSKTVDSEEPTELVGGEKSPKDAAEAVSPSPSVTSEQQDTNESVYGSRSPSIASRKLSSSHVITNEKIDKADEPIDLSSASLEGKMNGVDACKRPSIVDDKCLDSRKESVASIVTAQDSKLDASDAVQAMQKLAETIADKSLATCDIKDVETPRDDGTRSHSLSEAGEKSPKSRSPTASLIDDEVPGVLKPSDQATIAKEDASRKSSIADISLDKLDPLPSDSKKFCTTELEGAQKRGSVEIPKDIAGRFAEDYHTTSDKINEIKTYIVNKYIDKKERISPQTVEDIVSLYSISRHIILELIEAIIIEKNVPRDVIVSFPKNDETEVSPIVFEDDHVDVIDIPTAKQQEIENRIYQEFVTKRSKITSLVINELAAVTFISRHIIIMIIQKMVRDEKGLTPDMLEDGILDESTTEYVQSEAAREQGHESSAPRDERIESDLRSESTDVLSHSEAIVEDQAKIPDSKWMEVETYVMEECVKKRIKINLLVFEQIIMRTGVPRSVLLSVIDKIILSGKIPRTEMLDDAIYDEVETVSDRGSASEEKAFREATISKDRVTELSGKSTPDPRSSGYSTPEVRHYDDKFGKSMAYSHDYESPFHKAFVGGMTEIRTTHITTLSGKSTPDYTARGETPEESLSESISQAKFDEKFEGVESSEKSTSAVLTTEAAATTFTTTVHTVTEPIKTSHLKDDMVTRETASVEGEAAKKDAAASKGDRSAGSDEGEPEVVKKIITREIIEETGPVTEITIHKREIVEELPEAGIKTIESSSTDHDGDGGEVHKISRIVRETSSPETIEIVTVKTIETIVTDDTSPETIKSKLGSLDGTQDLSVTEHTVGDVKTVTTTVTMTSEPQTVEEIVEKSGSKSVEKIEDESHTTTQIISKVTYSAPLDSQQTEKLIQDLKEAATSSPTTTTSSVSQSRTVEDSSERVEKSKSVSQTISERIGIEKLDHPVSPVIKDLISGQRSFTGRTSPDVAPAKEAQQGGSTLPSAPDVPGSPFSRDSGLAHAQLSGRSTPDKRGASRSRTATPEGMRSNEVIRTTITTTRTMSDEGDIITTTMEITETTNEKGETIILAEKTDVKVEDRIIPGDMSKSTLASGFEALKAPVDSTGEADVDQVSPRSDHSSVQSRAGTHIWGSSEERYTYSDDDVPGSPLSTTSQVGYSPQSTYALDDHTFDKDPSRKSMEFSVADMSASFYGELPDLPPRVTTIKTTHLDGSGTEAGGTSEPIESDFSFKKFTVAKEFAGVSRDAKSEGKKYIDDADLDFEKALTEHKESKSEKEISGVVGSSSSHGSSSQPQSGDKKPEPKSDSKKDPLAGWDSPLGLPSPKPPRKFNLRTVARPTNNVVDESPDSINFDPINDWGEPLRLPSPAPVVDEGSNKGAPSTPKKERKQPKKILSENIKNRKRSESPAKNEKKAKDAKAKIQPVYMDLTYVPHHGNSYYTSVEFFKRVRARYYVFSGTEPSREVYDALLDAKKTWEDKDLEVTMIPTYDTDTLGYWVADNEEALAANHIDLSPSASRCTINLQDHETSCSAYRLEF
ncbi:microtubule-associated protein futsch isoform X2 [Venturia canescens]|uniref:microtubule-associated protein futsch isoform X2 n=1 Tax=Venturia canescens TaxID=32260 RepID=UPI001C9C8A43|nr:microtubule-associated protein futsch isoform X2 [Venturia canescens]